MRFIKELRNISVNSTDTVGREGGKEWGYVFSFLSIASYLNPLILIWSQSNPEILCQILLCHEREVLHNLVHICLVEHH